MYDSTLTARLIETRLKSIIILYHCYGEETASKVSYIGKHRSHLCKLPASPRIDVLPSRTASNRSASNGTAHLTDAVTGIKRGKKGCLKAEDIIARFEEAL